MNVGDLVLNLLLILTTCWFVDIKWYPQAVGVFMFYLLLQTQIVLVWLTRPLPRYVYGVSLSSKPKEEGEETEDGE